MTPEESRLLARIQESFPVTERPFEELGREVGMSESEVIETLRRWCADGLVRDPSPVFDAAKLGWVTALACVSVPEDRVDEVAGLLLTFAEVTHNYLRAHPVNVWFALVAPSRERVREILSEIEAVTGCGPARDLPALRLFKLRAVFGAGG